MTLSIDHPAPRCNLFAQWLGRSIIKIAGWKVAGGVPDSKSMIIIAAPHTSNWDLFFLLGAAYTFHLQIHFLIKNSLFVPVVGSILSFLGGIPVERSRSHNLVANLVERINASEGLTLVVPPAARSFALETHFSGNRSRLGEVGSNSLRGLLRR